MGVGKLKRIEYFHLSQSSFNTDKSKGKGLIASVRIQFAT